MRCSSSRLFFSPSPGCLKQLICNGEAFRCHRGELRAVTWQGKPFQLGFPTRRTGILSWLELGLKEPGARRELRWGRKPAPSPLLCIQLAELSFRAPGCNASSSKISALPPQKAKGFPAPSPSCHKCHLDGQCPLWEGNVQLQSSPGH